MLLHKGLVVAACTDNICSLSLECGRYGISKYIQQDGTLDIVL